MVAVFAGPLVAQTKTKGEKPPPPPPPPVEVKEVPPPPAAPPAPPPPPAELNESQPPSPPPPPPPPTVSTIKFTPPVIVKNRPVKAVRSKTSKAAKTSVISKPSA